MEYLSGNFRILIEEDYDAMSKKAADIFTHALKLKPNGVFGFATGSTPIGMYKELIKRDLDFLKITSFNLDEYYPILHSNPQSYHYFMQENLFGHVNINPSNINIPDGEAKGIEKECAGYEQRLRESGGVDLQILGIGNNGHIGFNEPSEYFPGATHYVSLEQSTIEANSRFFDSWEDIPKNAITMGIKSIMAAKEILLVVNGAKKAEIVREMIFDKITPKIPASVLQLHHNVTIVMDKLAASEIEVYFNYTDEP